jgi:hypothetical protein
MGPGTGKTASNSLEWTSSKLVEDRQRAPDGSRHLTGQSQIGRLHHSKNQQGYHHPLHPSILSILNRRVHKKDGINRKSVRAGFASSVAMWFASAALMLAAHAVNRRFNADGHC